jgi:mono/diheme cytochrome c family protein
MPNGQIIWRLCLWLVLALTAAAQPAHSGFEPGLTLTYKSLATGTSEVRTARGVSLFVQAGQAPSPFLAAGPFSATWEGTVSADLRSQVFFQAELNGSLTVEINGATVLNEKSAGKTSPLSRAVPLRKGTNSLRAIFLSPPAGDAFVRLGWTERPPSISPIPLVQLNHTTNAELKADTERRLGRELFLENRCGRCHGLGASISAAVPELAMDAPSLEAIGSRLNYDWMARWILDPKSLRPGAHMPKLLSGPSATENSKAIAAYLSSLTEAKTAPVPESTVEKKESGVALFEKLQCAVCHDAPQSSESDPNKTSLKHVLEKFAPGKLAEYLHSPSAHYAWNPMPDFKLSPAEAAALAEFLQEKAAQPKATPAPTNAAMIESGRKLVQTSGCLNCHALKLDNLFSAPALSQLTPEKWNRGCLAAEPLENAKAPRFNFSPQEQLALQAFAKTDRLSLARHAAAEFAERQTRLLNCARCHGQIDLVPPLDLLGGKLKPEWTARFLAGDVPYKPRAEKHPRGETWMEVRMPLFKSRAVWLAEGLTAQHGFPPRTPAEPPIDPELAKIGRKLASKDGGFSCVSCHAIGRAEASEVVESEGVNLAYAADRLLPAYYQRWLRNPARIDPQTKMPLYFEDDKSQLTDILDGDAAKQIDALWQYLRLGAQMTPPGPAP